MDNLSCGNLFFSTSSGAKQARRFCPARFMKMALEFDSAHADQLSGARPFLIGIIPEL
jgi:hypothetical protein